MGDFLLLAVVASFGAYGFLRWRKSHPKEFLDLPLARRLIAASNSWRDPK